MTNTDKILAEFSRLKARKERVNEGMCATCGSKENHNKVGKFGTFTHQWDNGGDATMFNEIDFISSSITQAIAEDREKMRGEIERLEVSCIDDRLLGKSDEYLDGYNTSTERWRKERDDLLTSLQDLTKKNI